MGGLVSLLDFISLALVFVAASSKKQPRWHLLSFAGLKSDCCNSVVTHRGGVMDKVGRT